MLRLPSLAALVVLLAPADAKTDRWEADIRKFEEADAKAPPAPGGIVFVGSSSIRLWDVGKAFPDLPCINRGFGGSHMADAVQYAERIVIRYKPRVVIVFAGGNDIDSGKTPEQVAADFRALVKKVHAALPEARMLFVSLFPNVLRRAQDEKTRKANELIEAFTKMDPRLGFVDTASRMRAPDGGPRPELLREDGLHMNDAGYRIWNEVVGAVLRKEMEK